MILELILSTSCLCWIKQNGSFIDCDCMITSYFMMNYGFTICNDCSGNLRSTMCDDNTLHVSRLLQKDGQERNYTCGSILNSASQRGVIRVSRTNAKILITTSVCAYVINPKRRRARFVFIDANLFSGDYSPDTPSSGPTSATGWSVKLRTYRLAWPDAIWCTSECALFLRTQCLNKRTLLLNFSPRPVNKTSVVKRGRVHHTIRNTIHTYV